MSHQSPRDDDGSTIPLDRYGQIRDLLIEKSPDDLRHELHGLIDSVREGSKTRDDIVRFIIGVSFTRRGTCFDYWIDRVITQADRAEHRVEEVKPPIDEGHPYLTFQYPPDPDFTADNLRGALLAVVERQQADAKAEALSTDDPPGILKRIIHAMRVLQGRKS